MSIMNRGHLLRQSSDPTTKTTNGGEGTLPQMPLMPLASSRHHISRLTGLSDDHSGIRRRESLLKATLQTTNSLELKNNKRSKRQQARYRGGSIPGILDGGGYDDGRRDHGEGEDGDPGWANINRPTGTTFLPQYLTTPHRTMSDTSVPRRTSFITEGEIYQHQQYQHLRDKRRPSHLDGDKTRSSESLVPSGNQYSMSPRHHYIHHSGKHLKKVKSFPQLVRKISLMNMMTRQEKKHRSRHGQRKQVGLCKDYSNC